MEELSQEMAINSISSVVEDSILLELVMGRFTVGEEGKEDSLDMLLLSSNSPKDNKLLSTILINPLK